MSQSLNARRFLTLIAKALFAIGVITFLFHKVDTRTVWVDLKHAEAWPIAVGVLLILFTVFIAGWRWHVLLAIFGIQIPARTLYCIAQIGQFFMMFLPGPTGDDLTRMLYISRLAPGRVGESCATVLFDRVIGLASVLALAGCCIPFQWHLLARTPQTRWLANAMLLGSAGVGIAAIIFLITSGQFSHRVITAILGRFTGHRLHDELVRMSELLCANKAAIFRVAAVAAGTQLLLCATYYLAGRAVRIEVPAGVWLSFVPIVIAANAFPVTVAGIGVREYLLVLFLRVLAHTPGEGALAASLLVFAMTLIVCLFGGILYIFFRPKKSGITITI